MRSLPVVITIVLSSLSVRIDATGGYGAPPPPPPPPPNSYGGGATNPPPAVSEGQCQFDASCWTQQPQCAIAKGIPFKRETGVSCEECLQLCLCTRSDPTVGPWRCEAATYDHRWQICDLFAVDGTEAPFSLVTYAGRDFFKPSGACDDQCGGPSTTAAPGSSTAEPVTTTTTEPAPDDICDEPGPDGQPQVAKFCRVDGFLLDAGGEPFPDAGSEADCIEACRSNALGTVCLTADWSLGACFLYDSAPPQPATADQLTPSPGDAWLMKVCVPAEYETTTGDVWDIVPDMILVGFVEEVVDATDPLDCKLQCLNAQADFGIECHSAMFYASDPDQNCLLNTETRQTFPENFVPEDPNLLASYLEIPLFRRRGNVAARRRLRDFTLARQGEFTKWSNCATSMDGKQYRYQRCGKDDIRKCPKQAKDCRTGALIADETAVVNEPVKDAAASGAAGCTVLVDAQGKKKCPLGVRMVNGVQKFCRDPPECSKPGQ